MCHTSNKRSCSVNEYADIFFSIKKLIKTPFFLLIFFETRFLIYYHVPKIDTL